MLSLPPTVPWKATCPRLLIEGPQPSSPVSTISLPSPSKLPERRLRRDCENEVESGAEVSSKSPVKTLARGCGSRLDPPTARAFSRGCGSRLDPPTARAFSRGRGSRLDPPTSKLPGPRLLLRGESRRDSPAWKGGTTWLSASTSESSSEPGYVAPVSRDDACITVSSRYVDGLALTITCTSPVSICPCGSVSVYWNESNTSWPAAIAPAIALDWLGS